LIAERGPVNMNVSAVVQLEDAPGMAYERVCANRGTVAVLLWSAADRVSSQLSAVKPQELN
jgi:hypothetical protein